MQTIESATRIWYSDEIVYVIIADRIIGGASATRDDTQIMTRYEKQKCEDKQSRHTMIDNFNNDDSVNDDDDDSEDDDAVGKRLS